MTTAQKPIRQRGWKPVWIAIAGTAVGLIGLLRPELALGTLNFVLSSFVAVAPLVIPGLLLSAAILASGAGARLSGSLKGNVGVAVLTAAALGTVTPVCGVTVLPLMTGLLAAGVPLAPVMAFWLSSPVTDPAMVAATVAVLGVELAVAKTLAAFLIGLGGGGVVAALARQSWIAKPLRATLSHPSDCDARIAGTDRTGAVVWRFWQVPARRERFLREVRSMTRLILICLTPAFAAEYLLQRFLAPETFADLLGTDSPWAIPLAVFVGAPAYIDGYAALPLTRSLMDHGMAPGAALAFLVSGGVVSIWGALAIVPVLRIRPFVLYLALGVGGSLAAGYLYAAIA
ncbi:permease [Thalassobaculum salexigens]|uniref:permease n=1 Tax=Thalassobaculum salexigens TaxID=455360 RepID=UPI00248E5845|nr:permease [Thalassobaculum salexigens]